MPTDSSSLTEMTTTQITLTYPCISACSSKTRNHIHKQNRTNSQIITLSNYLNKQIPGKKFEKQKIPKKPATQQNRSIRFGTKTAITDMKKAKTFNKEFTNPTPYSSNKIKKLVDYTIKNFPKRCLLFIKFG